MNCPWESIQKFIGPRELEQFYTWMNEQISMGDAEEIAVPDAVIAARCYRHRASGEVLIVTRNDGPLVPSFRRWL